MLEIGYTFYTAIYLLTCSTVACCEHITYFLSHLPNVLYNTVTLSMEQVSKEKLSKIASIIGWFLIGILFKL